MAHEGEIVANCWPLALQHVDSGDRGALTVTEGPSTRLRAGSALPFEPKRVYWMTGMRPGAERGRHAHKTLKQAIFCVSGRAWLDVDDGRRQASVLLDKPNEGFYVGPLVWHTLRDFSPGGVILVFAAAPYDESDYLRDYEAFLRYLNNPAG